MLKMPKAHEEIDGQSYQHKGKVEVATLALAEIELIDNNPVNDDADEKPDQCIEESESQKIYYMFHNHYLITFFLLLLIYTPLALGFLANLRPCKSYQ